MATPHEIEKAAGIEPVDEIERKRIWAAAQALAAQASRAPAAEDLALAASEAERGGSQHRGHTDGTLHCDSSRRARWASGSDSAR